MKTLALAGASCVLAVCLTSGTSPGGRQPHIPDLGFNYREFIAEHLTRVHAGKVDQAVEYLKANARQPKAAEAQAEGLKKALGDLYAGAGKHEYTEVVGYKRLSSRLYQFLVTAHYENWTAHYVYGFEKTPTGAWKWIHFSIKNLDEAAREFPYHLLDGK